MSELRIGMIGGAGQMGRFFQKWLPVPLEVASTHEESLALIPRVDVVIVGVPIDQTLEVIQLIAPLMKEGQLLLDITSLKQKPCEAMLASKASVIGLHPLFGPSVESFEGERLVMCSLRPGKWKKQVQEWFKGVLIVETTPQYHDEMMAIIQAFVHFLNMTFTATLKETGVPEEELEKFATPVFQMQREIAKRVFSQPSTLYGPIQMDNPYFPALLAQFEKVVEELKSIVVRKDKKAFENFFVRGKGK